mmetsp:Transcript_77421/g.232261  ORF Transcript_77421/g.232261 Transcript_77421/m.232261 type:complete len:213 (-) Transcript_77421:88-726(-)
MGMARPLGDLVALRVVVRQLSAGYDHTVAVDTAGVVWAWGARGRTITLGDDDAADAEDADDGGGGAGGSIVRAQRLPLVGQLGSAAPSRRPPLVGSAGGAAQQEDAEPAVAEALGPCEVVAAGGFFTVGYPTVGSAEAVAEGGAEGRSTGGLSSWEQVSAQVDALGEGVASSKAVPVAAITVTPTKHGELMLVWAASPPLPQYFVPSPEQGF